MSRHLQPRARRVKVLATLGPASASEEMISKLHAAGADAFRVNMSHGSHESQGKLIAAVRAVEKANGRPIAILADLQGPKLRVGRVAGGAAELVKGQAFRFDRHTAPGDTARVCLPHKEIFAALRPETESVAATAAPMPYWQLDWTQPTVLLLGNEGAGVSAELQALASQRVTIPHSPEVESLNVAVAAAPLLLERLRQQAGA